MSQKKKFIMLTDSEEKTKIIIRVKHLIDVTKDSDNKTQVTTTEGNHSVSEEVEKIYEMLS